VEVNCGGTSEALAAVPLESIMTVSSGEDTEEGRAKLTESPNRSDRTLAGAPDTLG